MQMTRSFVNQSIRIILAASLIHTPVAFANPGSHFTFGSKGQTVKGIRSPEGQDIFFEGRADRLGRPRVFAVKSQGQGGTKEFRKGVMELNGSITWDGAYNSRSAGQTQYPNYPKQKAAAAEPGRALVPVGPVVDQSKPAGDSGMANAGRGQEYLPEFDSKNKPSNLQKVLEWSDSKTAQLKKMFRQVIAGKRPLVDTSNLPTALDTKPILETEQEYKAKQFAKSPVGVFSYNAVIFYSALGFAAAWTLMKDYPNNPLAWDSYLESLTDPVGYAALAGFMIAAAPFFNKMEGTAYQGKHLRQFGLFTSALIAGTLASTAVSTLGNDKDFLACAGFTNYKINGTFRFDTASCDKLYQRFTSSEDRRAVLEQITVNFVPTAANVAVAGGLYLGAQQSLKFLINRPALTQALRSFPISKNPASGFRNGLISVLQLGLFLGAYEVSSSTFGVEKSVREYWISQQNLLFKNPNGTSLKEAEANLLGEWARVKANGWKDPKAQGGGLDFVEVLSRYSKLQASWRALQMQETSQAFNAWTKKVEDFQNTIAASHRFYKEVTDQIASPSGKIDLKAINIAANGTAPALLTKNYDKTWKHVRTPKLEEFLLTSLACGAEMEGYAGRSSWESIRQTMKTWVTGNTRPGKLVEDKDGFVVKFNPPRITAPLEGTSDTVCEQTMGLFTPMDWVSPLTYSPQSFPVVTENAEYKGLASYIEKNVRSSVFTPDGINRFEEWWSEYVAKQSHVLMNDLRTDFEKMLIMTFKPALLNTNYYWCDVGGSVKNTGLEKYMRRLSTGADDCGPEALHRLPYGILNSLRDEMKLYLAMMIDLFMNNAAKTPGGLLPGQGEEKQARLARSETDYENALIPRAQALIEKLDLLVRQAAISDASKRQDVERISDEAIAIYGELREIVYGAAMNNISTPNYQITWTEQLLDKSLNIFKESVNYITIVSTFETSPKGDQ